MSLETPGFGLPSNKQHERLVQARSGRRIQLDQNACLWIQTCQAAWQTRSIIKTRKIHGDMACCPAHRASRLSSCPSRQTPLRVNNSPEIGSPLSDMLLGIWHFSRSRGLNDTQNLLWLQIMSMERKKGGEFNFAFIRSSLPYFFFYFFFFGQVFKGKSLRAKEGMSHSNSFSLK